MSKNRYILGISAYYHDSAAAIIKDGKTIAAAHEERFTRKKHDASFPKQAIHYCLKAANIELEDLEAIVFYDKPFLKFERLLKTYLKTFPFGFTQFLQSIPIWLKSKLFLRQKIAKKLNIKEEKIFFSEHHISHAASACFTSSFSECAALTVDGVGEFATTSIGKYKNGKLTILKEIHFPHSLGLLYSTITGYLGFKVNSAEYKVMGLAPYGKDTFSKEVRQLVEIHNDGSFSLNMKYFDFEGGLKMHSKKLEKLFGAPARISESDMSEREFNIAHSLQKLTEELMLGLAKEALKATGSKNLTLAGGAALNCVANGKILEEKICDDIYIQPAAGDAGGALGAALYYHHQTYKNTTEQTAKTFSPYLGPKFSDVKIKGFLENTKASYTQLSSDKDCCKQVATLIDGDNVIGWFQGQAEFGPRALGNRSIIADARNKNNWQKVNLKIKFRESFRPFAPSVLEERLNDYFDIDRPSPYMLLVANVKTKDIPAVTHVDNSARIQSVNKEQNPKYYQLIKEFEKNTGCGVIINTSFNVRSEPIVLTPQDAWNVFINTEMDYLVLGNFLIKKENNLSFVDKELKEKHLDQFELD
jgi:carbamoyltransferase